MPLHDFLSLSLDILETLELLERQHLAIAQATDHFPLSADQERALLSLKLANDEAQETYQRAINLFVKLPICS